MVPTLLENIWWMLLFVTVEAACKAPWDVKFCQIEGNGHQLNVLTIYKSTVYRELVQLLLSPCSQSRHGCLRLRQKVRSLKFSIGIFEDVYKCFISILKLLRSNLLMQYHLLSSLIKHSGFLNYKYQTTENVGSEGLSMVASEKS